MPTKSQFQASVSLTMILTKMPELCNLPKTVDYILDRHAIGPLVLKVPLI